MSFFLIYVLFSYPVLSVHVLIYVLICYCEGSSFFDNWNFYDSSDPTHGFVDYVSESEARSMGLINATDGSPVYIGTDSTNVVGSEGRPSVRIESTTAYANGLFVLALDHQPTGCGTWPAFWLLGPDPWPQNGEVDIIEGVDKQETVSSTLHTTEGCDQSSESTDLFTGSWNTGADNSSPASNCDVNAEGQYGNQGCSISGPADSMGAPFNNGGGGTYATEFDPESHISMWYWPKGQEPSDVASGNPDPSTWGTPYAYFTLSDDTCPSSHFQDLHMIINLTFCGDWEGAVYASDCASEIASNGWPATCSDFVANYPQEFADAYWLVDSIKVYTKY